MWRPVDDARFKPGEGTRETAIHIAVAKRRNQSIRNDRFLFASWNVAIVERAPHEYTGSCIVGIARIAVYQNGDGVVLIGASQRDPGLLKRLDLFKRFVDVSVKGADIDDDIGIDRP